MSDLTENILELKTSGEFEKMITFEKMDYLSKLYGIYKPICDEALEDSKTIPENEKYRGLKAILSKAENDEDLYIRECARKLSHRIDTYIDDISGKYKKRLRLNEISIKTPDEFFKMAASVRWDYLSGLDEIYNLVCKEKTKYITKKDKAATGKLQKIEQKYKDIFALLSEAINDSDPYVRQAAEKLYNKVVESPGGLPGKHSPVFTVSCVGVADN